MLFIELNNSAYLVLFLLIMLRREVTDEYTVYLFWDSFSHEKS